MVVATITFQAGDQVQQAATTPPVMTVLKMGISQVETEWYVNGVRETGWFSPASLKLVAPKVTS